MYNLNIQQRWVFAVLCFIGDFHVFAIRTCLAIALTQMVIPVTQSESNLDDSCTSVVKVNSNTSADTSISLEGRYAWSEYTQGFILAAFSYGYIVTHIPGGQITKRYGGKHTVGLGILLSAVFTILIPLSVKWGDATGLIVTRVLIGLAQGIVYPGMNVMISNWCPINERSRTATLIYSGEALGTIYASSVGGVLLSNFDDWSYVFYLIGGTGVVWYLFWLTLCYNNPREHPFISKGEKDFLNDCLSEHVHEKSPPIPWLHIFKSKALWAALAALAGFDWHLVTIVMYLPKYMNTVLKLPVDQNGFLNTLVYLSMWVVSLATSCLADFIIRTKYLSITNMRKVGSIVSLSTSACFVIAASYAGCDQVFVVSMFAIAMGLLGTAYPSIVVNTLDLSPNYSGILMALNNGLSAGLTGILSPYVISSLAPNQTLNEWRLVFWILFVISVSSNIIFLLFGSAEVQYWNNLKSIESECEKKSEERGHEKSDANVTEAVTDEVYNTKI